MTDSQRKKCEEAELIVKGLEAFKAAQRSMKVRFTVQFSTRWEAWVVRILGQKFQNKDLLKALVSAAEFLSECQTKLP